MARNSEIADLGAGFTSATINSTQHIKKNPPLFFSYYINGTGDIPHATNTELGGSTSGLDVTWAKQTTTSVTGSTDADPFSKFAIVTGRYTPGVSGFYFFSYFLNLTEDLSDTKLFQSYLSRNGVVSTGTKADIICFTRTSQGTSDNLGLSGSGCINLDTNDYVSIHVYHNHGSARQISTGRFSGFYLGENF